MVNVSNVSISHSRLMHAIDKVLLSNLAVDSFDLVILESADAQRHKHMTTFIFCIYLLAAMHEFAVERAFHICLDYSVCRIDYMHHIDIDCSSAM